MSAGTRTPSPIGQAGVEAAGAAGGCGRLCKTLRAARRRRSAFHTTAHNHLENSPPLPPPVFLSPLENRAHPAHPPTRFSTAPTPATTTTIFYNEKQERRTQ